MALLSALPAPSLAGPKGTEFPSSLFGLLINCNCSSLSVTWQAKIYDHHPRLLFLWQRAEELSSWLCPTSRRA